MGCCAVRVRSSRWLRLAGDGDGAGGLEPAPEAATGAVKLEESEAKRRGVPTSDELVGSKHVFVILNVFLQVSASCGKWMNLRDIDQQSYTIVKHCEVLLQFSYF